MGRRPDVDAQIYEFLWDAVQFERQCLKAAALGQPVPDAPPEYERIIEYMEHTVALAGGDAAYAAESYEYAFQTMPRASQEEFPPGVGFLDAELGLVMAFGVLTGKILKGAHSWNPHLAAEGLRRGWRKQHTGVKRMLYGP